MNQDLTRQLAEWQAQAAELAAKIADAQEALAKPTSWERWKPRHRQEYFFVQIYGRHVGSSIWSDANIDHALYDWGNCFKTGEAAELHAKRIRSMVPTCPVPKVGQRFWYVLVYAHGVEAVGREWQEGNPYQISEYNLGRIFTTKDAALSWIAEFADAWSTLEDAS